MKKLFVLLIGIFFAFSLVACTETVSTTQSTVLTTADLAPEFVGVQDVRIIQGSTFNPLSGIVATDVKDGDLTSSIVVVQSVNVDVLGDYVVNLSVTDSSGNVTIASFTVTVSLMTNEDKANLDISLISFESGISLPAFGANGSSFYWKSNNIKVLTSRGFIIPPPVGSGPVTVTLTARVVNGSFTTSKDFYVTIEPNGEVTVTSKISVPFEGTSEEYVVANQESVDLYFVDNGTVPYIDIETFINLIQGALQSDIIVYTVVADDILQLSYEIEYEDFDGTMVTETYTAVINFTDNTFTVNNFDFFEGYVAETSSDYGEGLNYTGADYVDGLEVTIPLGAYNFDLVTYEGEQGRLYLMPFHVADLLFAGGIYYDVYYNGDKLWGIDTFGISGSDAADLALQNTIRVSSKNSTAAALDMKWATYNYLALAFDYFYGLKEDKGVVTYYDILCGYAESIMNGSDINLYKKIFQIAYGLDDLHTSHVFPGYYETPYSLGLSISDLGSASTAFYNGLWAVQDLMKAKYGSVAAMPEFSIIDGGKTCVIHLTGFTIDSPDAFKVILDGLSGTVENVVIDLSYNTGGNVGAVLRIFGYMTENPITYHSQNPADGSAVTYYIESDYVAYDYNWFIVTSSVTFSAANLMASIAKEQGIPIMGKHSSGGASSIGAIFTPDGSCLLISTNNVLSARVGNEVDGYEYLSVEYGIDVDYTMINVTSDAEIIAIIAAYLAE